MHVPFCDVRCPYCHFACFVNRDAGLFDRWARAVVEQFRRQREHFSVERVASLYFGGGTPTALPPSARELLAGWLEHEVGPLLAPGAEVTLEANPESAWPESLAPWARAGVNRLSLGLQSMDAEVLRFLGRLNTPDSNRRVLDLACGLFDNVSVDFIVGSPPDDLARMTGGIDEVLRWPVRHVSAYLLEIHAATRFGRDLTAGRLRPKPDEEQVRIYHALAARLADAGFAAYELSNFARPGFESRHNRRYWERQPYLGTGPSAHAQVDRWRWAEVRDTVPWTAAVEEGRVLVEDLEEIDAGQAREEAILLGLRLREGIDPELVSGREALVRDLVGGGLLEERQGRLGATLDGWLLLDQIVARLCA